MEIKKKREKGNKNSGKESLTLSLPPPFTFLKRSGQTCEVSEALTSDLAAVSLLSAARWSPSWSAHPYLRDGIELPPTHLFPLLSLLFVNVIGWIQ